jgi:toxin ParE1/3/4
MAQRKLVRRPAAQRDLADVVRYLRTEGGATVSHRFLDEVEATFTRLRSFPTLGTPWPTTRRKLVGLRRRLLPHFPYSVFYLPREKAIEIVRILHNSWDLPTLLEDL